ncbi:MAG: methyltransferase [Candidatus Cyclobacteriaceae bacterium M2_1C_046]
MKLFQTDDQKAVEAKTEAQKIVWAPFTFQSARALRDLGILEFIKSKSRKGGATIEEVSENCNLSIYGARVLMEAGLGINLLYLKDEDKYAITKTGVFILSDRMTNVNMDFVNDVCYEGISYLKESILNGKPEGLKVFGDWDTVYEGLSKLPKDVQESWFNFDHYYSDTSFPKAIPHILKDKPKTLFDVGGNTGKFSMLLAESDPDIRITILDLPGQLEMAKKNIEKKNLQDRISGYPINLLDKDAPFPKKADAIWMSQFLDCFSEEEITSILKRAKEAIDKDGAIYILETYWDRQEFEAAAFSLQQISLYFTTMANGNSQMYHSKNMIKCVHDAGLYIEEDIDQIGISHTLFKCRRRDS